MKKMWAVYAVIAAIVYVLVNSLIVAGAFKSIQPHLEGTTSLVYSGIPGPEDMDMDNESGLLFISSTNRRKTMAGLPSNDGIFVLSADSAQQPRKLATTYPAEFHPHGISFLRIGIKSYLFVVNHNPAGNFVEIFEYTDDTLFHQQSITDPSMNSPNDVVAVATNKFYVTNDHGTQKGFKRTLEDFLQLPFSSLLYYNGVSFSKAYGGLKYANGVNVSNDGLTLYVTTTRGRNLLTFNRDQETGGLTLANKLSLKSGVDNIDVDADGSLWIAAHPNVLAFVGHAKDSTKLSPSQVLKLTLGPGTTYQVEEVFMDDGRQLSASSIAIRYKGELFVSGVFQRKILRIALKAPSKP